MHGGAFVPLGFISHTRRNRRYCLVGLVKQGPVDTPGLACSCEPQLLWRRRWDSWAPNFGVQARRNPKELIVKTHINTARTTIRSFSILFNSVRFVLGIATRVGLLAQLDHGPSLFELNFVHQCVHDVDAAAMA